MHFAVLLLGSLLFRLLPIPYNLFSRGFNVYIVDRLITA